MESFTKLLQRYFFKCSKKYIKIPDWLKSPIKDRKDGERQCPTIPFKCFNYKVMKTWLNALQNSFLKEVCHGELAQSKSFPLVREQRKALLATKKWLLSCNPLDMNVPFKIYLAFFKSWMLRDKVCEKHRKSWFNCFSTHSLRNRSNDQIVVEVRA